MEGNPRLITNIKVEPPEVLEVTMGSEYFQEDEHPQNEDPLVTEIKVEQAEESQETQLPQDTAPKKGDKKSEKAKTKAKPKKKSETSNMVKIVPNKHLNSIKPKTGKRMKLACQECGKVCSSAAFLARHKLYCKPPNADGMLPCHVCPAVFKQVVRLKYHLTTHTGEKTFKCRNVGCTEAFFYPETRYNHEDACRKKTPEICAICGQTFQYAKTLRVHMITHEEPKFECQICNKKFFFKRNLQTHWLTHFKDKVATTSSEPSVSNAVKDPSETPSTLGNQEVISSDVGEKQSTEESTENPSPLVHICNLCGKGFPMETYLTRHRNFCSGFIPLDPSTLDGNPENIVLNCSVCGKLQESVEALKAHIVQHESAQFKCEVCGQCFSTRSILKRHGVVHSDVRLFACSVCDKRFKSNQILQAHLRTHIEVEKLSCSLCSETFSNSHRLKYHMNKHSGERPYKCRTEGCDQAFYQPELRNRHEECCGKQELIVCEICKTYFKSKKYLRVHMAGHNPRFNCEYCGKTYPEKYRLKTHMTQAHPENADMVATIMAVKKEFLP